MIEKLTIEEKTQNQGATSAGKLTALEFNQVKDKVNELVTDANKTVYCTQEEYDALVSAGTVESDVEYNIYDE